jgi:hypothetical protein
MFRFPLALDGKTGRISVRRLIVCLFVRSSFSYFAKYLLYALLRSTKEQFAAFSPASAFPLSRSINHHRVGGESLPVVRSTSKVNNACCKVDQVKLTKHWTLHCRRAHSLLLVSRQAAERPLSPAPMMTTSTEQLRGLDQLHHLK